MTHATRMAAAGCLLALTAQAALATLQVASYSFLNGSETVAAYITYNRELSVGGDSTYVLKYDFNANGGANPVLRLPVYTRPTSVDLGDTSWGVSGTHVRLRLRAPLASRILVFVYDPQGNELTPPTTGAEVSRQGLTVDDQGWSSVLVPLATSGARVIGRVEVKVLRPDAAVEEGALAATLYVRELQVLNGTSQTPYPSQTVHVLQASALNGTLSSLPTTPKSSTSDGIQRLTFDFSPTGSQYGAAVMNLEAPAEASYARFRARAPQGVGLRLVLVTPGGTFYRYDIDRANEVLDEAGWATYTVRLDRYSLDGVQGRYAIAGKTFSSVQIQARKLSDVTGTVLMRDVDLLTSAPSAAAPLEARWTPFDIQPSASTVNVLPYDFSLTTHPQPLAATVERAFVPTPTVQANRLSFQARVPQGVAIRAKFQGSDGKWFDTDVLKPFATVDDAGWVQYGVNLEPGLLSNAVAQPIVKVALVVRRNTNVGLTSITDDSNATTGHVDFRQVWLGREADQLDLSFATPTVTTLKSRGSYPLPPKLGLVARTPDEQKEKDLLQNLLVTRSAGSHIKYGRLTLTWDSIASFSGGSPTYTWVWKDTAVKALVAKNLTPVLILAYNNKSYLNGTSDKVGVSTTDNLKAYLQYVRDVVSHYYNTVPETQGKALVYEIWNEPNSSAFWGPSTNSANYAALMVQAAVEVKRICGACQVVSAGLARIDFPFLRSVASTIKNAPSDSPYSLANFNSKVDALGVHPYTLLPDVAPESQVDELVALRAYLAANFGIDKPLWITELGYSSSIGDLQDSTSTLGAATPVDGRTVPARAKQAGHMVRELLSTIAYDSPMHILYNLRDWYADYGSYNRLEKEHNFGLYEGFVTATNDAAENGNIKPAGVALSKLIQWVGGLKYQGLVTGAPSNVQAMKFGHTSGDDVYLVWMNGPGRHAAITVTPNCAANSQGAVGNWANCVRNMQDQAPDCTSASANGRVVCRLTEAGGPLLVRTRGH